MGIFGKPKLRPYDGAPAVPLAFADAAPITPMGAMPNIQTPDIPQPKRSFFGQGGIGRLIAGSIGDALTQNAGLGTPFMSAMQQRQQQDYEDELYQRRSAQDWAKFVKQKQWERDNPEPDAYDRELAANGIYPGTPEYAKHRANRLKLKDDPVHMINGPDGGPILVGGPYGYPGQTQPQGEAYDELPPGYTVGGAGSPAPRNFP